MEQHFNMFWAKLKSAIWICMEPEWEESEVNWMMYDFYLYAYVT